MSNTKQTALQESIKYLNLRKKYLLYGGEPSTTSAINEVDNCIKYLESKLELEKEQMIEHSFNFYYDLSNKKGVPFNLISENRILAEEYYKEKYNIKQQ
jgi:hypothetical protein